MLAPGRLLVDVGVGDVSDEACKPTGVEWSLAAVGDKQRAPPAVAEAHSDSAGYSKPSLKIRSLPTRMETGSEVCVAFVLSVATTVNV
jgi:hypothetical protein